jgi:uncharacterized cupin superfamily protein
MLEYLGGARIEAADFVPRAEPGDHLQDRGPDPKTNARLDVDDDIAGARAFECGPCEIDIVRAPDEHPVVLEGEHVITEVATGRPTRYGPGDRFILLTWRPVHAAHDAAALAQVVFHGQVPGPPALGVAAAGSHRSDRGAFSHRMPQFAGGPGS